MDKRSTLPILYGAYVIVDQLERKVKKESSIRINAYLIERGTKGRFVKDFEDLKKHRQSFYENFHMDSETYEEIFAMVDAHLTPKRNTRPEENISANEKFAVVIEYLAIQALQIIVPSIKKSQFIEWSNEFNSQWQFPNCVGAINGKHVALKAPPNARSLFYNYKINHSIVLMAVADAKYKFTFLYIGAYGSEGDASVFSSSKFGQNVTNDKLDFPEDTTINGEKVPFVFLADDAFPLCKRIIKPYGGKQNLSDEERILNNRLSRARRCVENAFGVL